MKVELAWATGDCPAEKSFTFSLPRLLAREIYNQLEENLELPEFDQCSLKSIQPIVDNTGRLCLLAKGSNYFIKLSRRNYAGEFEVKLINELKKYKASVNHYIVAPSAFEKDIQISVRPLINGFHYNSRKIKDHKRAIRNISKGLYRLHISLKKVSCAVITNNAKIRTLQRLEELKKIQYILVKNKYK